MRIHDLSPSKGSRKSRKRVGRGTGSGHGKTSCRGYKGQRARSGGGKGPGFEGGQMPLQRRLPKRGFTNVFAKSYAVINLKNLLRFGPDKTLDIEAFVRAGLVKKLKDGVKLLGQGDISFPLHVRVNEISKTARQKIEAAGGRVEIV
jgi:large subunit ribosomal protein L15